jgi:hypothetical protein
MVVLLKSIVDALVQYPDLYSTIPILQIERFVRFTRQLKREIQIYLPQDIVDSDTPPFRLPQYVHEFLRDALVFTDLETMQCWGALKGIIWNEWDGASDELTAEEAALFQLHGSKATLPQNERIGEPHLIVCAV